MKLKWIITFSLLIVSCCLGAQTSHPALYQDQYSTYRTVTYNGIGLGSALAMVLSWDRNRSILWAVLHGLFSWIYVIYFAISRK